MIISTRMEAQIVYLDLKKTTLKSGAVTENWTYCRLPITTDRLKFAPTLPDNCRAANFDETERDFLCYLRRLYGKGGDMDGWYDSFLVHLHVFFCFLHVCYLVFLPPPYIQENPFDRRPHRQPEARWYSGKGHSGAGTAWVLLGVQVTAVRALLLRSLMV